VIDHRRISKLLSLMLRHRPDEFGLNLDEYGFAPVDEIVEALQQRYAEVTKEDVCELVEGSGQRRFEIRDEAIRALYAHSFYVEMDGEPMDPPESLYMACEAPAARKMKEEGIKPADRFYLHLSLSKEAAESRTRRLEAPCVIEILAREAHGAEGAEIEFYSRGEVVLTREIPPDFVGEITELAASRVEPERPRPRRSRPVAKPEPKPRPEPTTADEPSEVSYGRKPRRVAGNSRR